MKLRVAVLGAGNIASSHLKALQGMERLEAVAIADLLAERASKLAAEFGIRPYTDYREMVEKEKPALVIIALPPYLHKESAVWCASQGCHLLLEKPMAMNVQECDDIIEAAEANGVSLLVGHTMHYLPINRLAKQVIGRTDFGELVMINETRHCHYFHNARLDWFFKKDKSGGGIFMNLGSHSIDKMQWLTGSRIAKVKAALSYKGSLGDIEAAGTALLETSLGVPASVSLSGHPGVPRFDCDFIFTRGVIRIDYGSRYGVWVSDSNEFKLIPVEERADPYRLQLIDMLDCMENGKEPECNGRYSKGIISAIAGVYRSAETGTEQSISAD
ncbi:Gfo/Idh/MocA family protein [Paenibacillus silvisoli]|uniref:Gfo/Idh/MocA family protein n=1 Tax=Paenibacillus silvisoli TaxID=3110539 RepID=UPI002804197A|nr:Gfo/Idh/MocA family oxidoreductase [Paenibacillus silvisoli]